MQQKDVGAADVGGISKLMHDVLRSINKTASVTDCTYVFLNQITYKIGVMFGNPETSPGGKALAYYACMRFKLLNHKESENMGNAHLVRVKCAKNKCAPPFQGVIEIDFVYSKGPDKYMDLINVAKEYKLVRMVHHAAKYKLAVTGDEVIVPGIDDPEIKPAGAAGLYKLLSDTPELYNQLRSAVLDIAIVSTDAKPTAADTYVVPGDEEDSI